MYELVKAKLENYPDFRERKFRGKYLAILALRETGLENRQKGKEFIDLGELSDFAIKYSSLEREWRKVLADTPTLQGKDYLDKNALEMEKQITLGYQPMHEINKKELSKL